MEKHHWYINEVRVVKGSALGGPENLKVNLNLDFVGMKREIT